MFVEDRMLIRYKNEKNKNCRNFHSFNMKSASLVLISLLTTFTGNIAMLNISF